MKEKCTENVQIMIATKELAVILSGFSIWGGCKAKKLVELAGFKWGCRGFLSNFYRKNFEVEMFENFGGASHFEGSSRIHKSM